jgi:hypothetical protein
VYEIGDNTFRFCRNLTSVTFQGPVTSGRLGSAFNGDLRSKFLAGGAGTYTTTAPVNEYLAVWTKQQ